MAAPEVARAGGGVRPIRVDVPAAAAFCVVVAAAAGASAVALLVWPADTEDYFSWPLRPPAAAALIGGLYLASSALFGWVLTLPWRQARSLFVGSLGLSVPTLVLTIVHDEVFEPDRWQAVAWVVLFLASPAATLAVLVTAPRDEGHDEGRRLVPWTRWASAGLALVLGIAAWAVWVDRWRADVGRWAPVELVGLTGAYLGSWCAFLAVLLGWGAARDRWVDLRVPAVALVLAPAGMALAVVRSWDEVHRPAWWLVVAVVLGGAGVAIHAGNRSAATSRG